MSNGQANSHQNAFDEFLLTEEEKDLFKQRNVSPEFVKANFHYPSGYICHLWDLEGKGTYIYDPSQRYLS